MRLMFDHPHIQIYAFEDNPPLLDFDESDVWFPQLTTILEPLLSADAVIVSKEPIPSLSRTPVILSLSLATAIESSMPPSTGSVHLVLSHITAHASLTTTLRGSLLNVPKVLTGCGHFASDPVTSP